MQVAFVPNTHYAFTVGKDGAVKYWDADRWELLLTLEGHKAEVSQVASAPDGNPCLIPYLNLTDVHKMMWEPNIALQLTLALPDAILSAPVRWQRSQHPYRTLDSAL